MTCEVFESVGSIYVEIPVSPKPSPPGSSRSSVEFWEDSTKMDEPDDGQCNLRSEAVNHMLSWANRMHPSDIQLDRNSVSEGYKIAELLCFLNNNYFDDSFLEKVHENEDTSLAGNVRRNEIIRHQIRSFYLSKCSRDLDSAPLFFVPASEIVEQDEDALLGFMFVIYGVSIILKNNSTNEFAKLLQSKSSECQEYVKKKEAEFVSHLAGKDPTNYAEVAKELRIKLAEKNKTLIAVHDECSNLKFELANQKEELNRYAENSIMSQELQRKLLESKQLEKQIKDQEEMIHKLEADLSERNNLFESVSAENSKLKFDLDDIREELRDLKDDKSEVEHRLSAAESKANDFEQKYLRIRDNNSKLYSQRDYDALMDRNMKNLKIISDYEQKNSSLETYRMTLSSKEAQLEQMTNERNTNMGRIYSLEQSNRELKKRLKEAETLSLNNSRMEFESSGMGVDLAVLDPTSPNFDVNSVDSERTDTESTATSNTHTAHSELQSSNSLDLTDASVELVRAQVDNSRLESEKQVVEEELKQQKRYAENERKENLALIAKFRSENEQLAINFETTKNELFKLKSSSAALEDKFKRLEEERSSLKALNTTNEQTIKRAGIIITEYVCQNEDGSSGGMSGGEVLQLKTDVKRLEEQLRQKRSQSDAYRHISTEEQRLITTEWYEQASQQVRQKYLLSNNRTNGDRALHPDQLTYSTHSHLSDLQNSALSSARSTPTHTGHQNTSTNSTPSSSMSNSVNAETSGVIGQVRSFLGLQRDQQTHRTPASGLFKVFLWLMPMFVFLLVRVLISFAYDEPFTVFGTYQRGVSMPFERNNFQLIVKKMISIFSKF